MPDITLVAQTGRATGSRSSNRLRHTDRIPGVVYGQGVPPTSVAVERRELRHALTGPAGVNAVISLTLDGAVHPVVVKDLQRHKVRRNVIHIDFLVVNLDEEITVEIPIVLVGESKAVEAAGYLVDPQINSFTVSCRPNVIPNEIIIDVSSLEVGDSVKVGDITLPAGVTTPLDPEITVVATLPTRAAMSEEAEAAADQAEGAGEAGAED